MGRKNKPCRVERIADKIAGFAWKRFDRNRRNNDLLPYRIERCVGVNFKHISGVVISFRRVLRQCPTDKSIAFPSGLCVGKSDTLVLRLCLRSRCANPSVAVIGDGVFFDGCKMNPLRGSKLLRIRVNKTMNCNIVMNIFIYNMFIYSRAFNCRAKISKSIVTDCCYTSWYCYITKISIFRKSTTIDCFDPIRNNKIFQCFAFIKNK